jgi:DNA-binding LacI/PurR family transcriptional regulator
MRKPMYHQIYEDLKKKIKEGEFPPNEAFPTQVELANIYGTSEITTRRALSELVNEGFIYRIRGKGTFINDNFSVEPESIIKRIYLLCKNIEIDFFNHPFFSDMLNGIHDICTQNNIHFSIYDIGETSSLPDSEDAAFILLPIHFDGAFKDELSYLKNSNRKMITIHFIYPHLKIPYLVVDNFSGGFIATQHLLSLGHRRIGIVLTGKSILEMNQEFSLRLQGYRQALLQDQIPFDQDLVRIIKGDRDTEEIGSRGFRELINLKDPPTAIFFTSDYEAIGGLKEARKNGISVPDEISIVGYDDILPGRFYYPRLTTLNQNTYELGKRAVELLLFEEDEHQMNRDLKEQILPRLIIRESSCKPKNKE